MTKNLTGSATFTSWDEVPVHDSGAPVPRVARATVAFSYEGDFQGTSTCEYAMYYAAENKGSGVGIEYLRATVDGEEGTVALRNDAAFDGGADIAWTVVPGSG